MKSEMFRSCTEGTENRMFELDQAVLIPEVTNYIRSMGKERLGTDKVWYVAKCFRNETTTDASRLREFTQVGIEFLSENSLDARRDVRRLAISIMKTLLPAELGFEWSLNDDVKRGLNLYDSSGKTFEISGAQGRQLLGGGPYVGGAGWALGLERLMLARAKC